MPPVSPAKRAGQGHVCALMKATLAPRIPLSAMPLGDWERGMPRGYEATSTFYHNSPPLQTVRGELVEPLPVGASATSGGGRVRVAHRCHTTSA